MVRTHVTRSSLLQRARQGDSDEFVAVYAPLAYAMARKRGLDQDSADDVVQAVMLKLLERLPSFEYDRSRGSFKGYVKTIVGNTIIDQARRAKARPTVSDEVLESVPVEDEGFAQLFDREWIKTHLLAALDKVRKEVRVSTFLAFQMTVLREMSVPEVAEALDLSNNQVSQYKRRVLQRLRAHLAEALDD